MSKGAYPLKLPLSLKQAAERLAREDGVSLNQWIAIAVAQKVGAVESAASFLARRSSGASPKDLRQYFDRAPDIDPDPSDRIDP